MGSVVALFCSFILFFYLTTTGAVQVGVNYGMLGDNLPSQDKVIALLKLRNIQRIRIFDPNQNALNALANSGIEVIVGTLNNDLPQLAQDKSFAKSWINTNIVPYANTVRFRCISAGNEVIPSEFAGYVHDAIINLHDVLQEVGLQIPVSTAIAMVGLEESFPPSAGRFSEATVQNLSPVVQVLKQYGYPLLVNVYPYFAYASNPNDISLDYALFRPGAPGVPDGALVYTNLFDAMVDSVISGIEKLTGGSDVDIIIAETGWPSAGNGAFTTVDNAMTYNNNLIAHLGENKGTPKKPNIQLETYLFALFNEDLKPAGVESNFGLYHPDGSEVYHVNFP